MMYRFIAGFAVGVYVGTFYDCKPTIARIMDFLRDNAPKEK
jgi:hypothetical protein